MPFSSSLRSARVLPFPFPWPSLVAVVPLVEYYGGVVAIVVPLPLPFPRYQPMA
jgi:hypothetical protein